MHGGPRRERQYPSSAYGQVKHRALTKYLKPNKIIKLLTVDGITKFDIRIMLEIH
jgi:hypothetical protein